MPAATGSTGRPPRRLTHPARLDGRLRERRTLARPQRPSPQLPSFADRRSIGPFLADCDGTVMEQRGRKRWPTFGSYSAQNRLDLGRNLCHRLHHRDLDQRRALGRTLRQRSPQLLGGPTESLLSSRAHDQRQGNRLGRRPQMALTSPRRAAGQPPVRNVRSARISSGVNKTAKKR